MERLLKDAQALTGVKYDINNLADVYLAIHAIQKELGITGTTAKEAEKTITGSANMMKAAWKNVLSAIAGGGDLDRAINNLVFSISKYFENIVPVVQRSLVGIGKLIEQVAPMLVQNVASALIQAIPSLINAVYQMIVGLAKGIWQGIKALFTGGSGDVTADIKTNVSGVAESANAATEGITDLGNATEEAGEKAKKAIAPFDELQIIASNSSGGGASELDTIASDFGGGVTSEMNIVSEDESQVTFLDTILEKLNPIKEIFLSGFWEGFQNVDFSSIINSFDGIKNSLSNIFTSTELQTAGTNFANSIIYALGQMVGSTASIGTTLATNLVGGFDKYLKSNSEFIKTRLTNIFDASAEIAILAGNMWSAFANIFSAFATEDGQQLTANIIGIFSNSVLSITELASKIGADFMALLTQPIVDNQDELREALEGVVGVFATISGSILSYTTRLFEGIIDLYDEHISPFVQSITDGLSELVGTFTESFNTYILPVFQDFADDFSAVVEENIKPAIDKFLGFIGSVVDLCRVLWENWLQPFVDWLIQTLAPIFSTIFSNLGDSLNIFLALVSEVFGAVFGVLDGFVTFLTGIFTQDMSLAWEGIEKIWSSITGFFEGIWGIVEDIFSTTWENIKTFWNNNIAPIFTLEWWKNLAINCGNGLINGFESAINAVIGMFETMINWIVNGLNKISFDVPDWVPGIGGKTFGFDIPEVSFDRVSIPRLAKGTVLPGGKPFLAVVNDNPAGKPNIEAPAELIKQMAMEALMEVGATGQTVKEEHYYLNETELMSVIYRLANGGKRLAGDSLIEGGAY